MKMSYNRSKIEDIVMGISENSYVLPAIQRELVWSCERIEKLFDSILSGYPINSMLFWKYKLPELSPSDENTEDTNREYKEQEEYKFYKFLSYYDEQQKEHNHNEEFNLSGHRGKEINAILDGQQRLTALFLGLKGYMNLKKPYYRADKSKNYEKKYLYLNLLYDKSHAQEDDSADNYEFKFKTESSVAEDNNKYNTDHLWFKMQNLLDCKVFTIFKRTLPDWFLDLPQDKQEKIEVIYDNLKEAFMVSENINYYEEKTTSLDKALQIFVRINSGGVTLGYTDFLMSMIVSQWNTGKDEINKAIDDINDEYNFDIPKDIFLRSCLYLTDSPLVFKADTFFKQQNIIKIKTEFKEIVNYLKASCRLFNRLGYNKDNLKSNLILLPVAQFLRENRKENIDISNMQLINKWIQLSILSRVFAGQTPAYLTAIRKDINGQKEFPLDAIKATSSKMGKSMNIDADNLHGLIDDAKKSSQLSWAILTLLYPNKDYTGETFHEDHIYPHAKMPTNQLKKQSDCVANLQLLPSEVNESKSATMPDEWLRQRYNNDVEKIREYKERNYIPQDIELTLENFDMFIDKRKKLIFNKLSDLLSCKISNKSDT